MNVESGADTYGKNTKGDVLKRIRNWEMQILRRTGSKEMQDLCEFWMSMPESNLKDAVYANILSGEKTAAKIQEILKERSRKKKESSMPEEIVLTTPTLETAVLEPLTPFCCTECNPLLFKDKILQEIEKQADKKGVAHLKSTLKKGKYKNWEGIIAHLVEIVKEATAKQPRKRASSTSKKTIVCYNCSQKGHVARLCPNNSDSKNKGKKGNKTIGNATLSDTRVFFDGIA